MVSVLVRAMVVASMVFAASCSLLIDTDRVQCKVQSDCIEIGAGHLDCNDSVCEGDAVLGCMERSWATSETGIPAAVAISVFTLGTPTAVEGVQFNACAALGQEDCDTAPVASGVSGPGGVATVPVYQGFRGHYEVATIDGFAPYILHMNPPPDPSRPNTLTAQVLVANIPALNNLASGLTDPVTMEEIMVESALAHLFFSTRDCQGRVMSGVRVAVEGGGPAISQPIYLAPSGAIDKDAEVSSAAGQGAIVNISAGTHTVTGSLNGVQIFRQPMIFEAGTITTTQIVPTKP